MSLEGQEADVPHSLEAACVKLEPQWDSDDANYELSEEQLDSVVLKEELELGPVVLQPPDAVYALRALQKKEETDCRVQAVPRRTCSVVLEHMIVDMELCVCKIGHRIYEFQSCPENDVSQSDEELNSSNKFGMLVKEEVVECPRESARGASAGRGEPADCAGPRERRDGREARRGTGRVPISANVGNQIHAKTDIDTEKGTFVCDICEQRFALKARLIEHVVVHIHSTEREESERGVAGDALQKKEETDCRVQAVPRRTCSVVLEHMIVDMELCLCKIGHQIYEFRSCHENDINQSDEELNSSKKFGCPARLGNKEGQAKTDKSKVLLQKKKEKRKRKIIPNSDKRPFKCNQCSSTFTQRCRLKSHLRTHTGEKQFKCNDCGSVFTEKWSLLRHLRKHTGEKPYKCNRCTSTFTQRGNLQSHLRTHTGEKPFKCNQCSATFTRSDALQAHLRLHTGEKPFKCNHCSSMFTLKGNLQSHLRTHTGEKPFKCNRCTSTFRQSGHLQRHLRTHTGDN